MSQSPEHIFPKTSTPVNNLSLFTQICSCFRSCHNPMHLHVPPDSWNVRPLLALSLRHWRPNCITKTCTHDLRSPSTRAAINMFANFHRRSNCNYSSEHNFTASQACSIIYLSLGWDYLRCVCNCDNFDCYRNLFSFLFRSTKAFLEFFVPFRLNRVLSSLLFSIIVNLQANRIPVSRTYLFASETPADLNGKIKQLDKNVESRKATSKEVLKNE